jgi:hypothetical protein
MSAGVAGPLRWPLRRWSFLVALVFAVQVGAIFFLSDNSPLRPRSPVAAPTLHLSGNSASELLALSDPTLFALPHREAFSGDAWLKMPAIPSASFTWTEAPRWLTAPTQELGAAFHRVLESYTFDHLQPSSRSEPELTLPKISSVETPASRSTFRIVGALASRRLLAPLETPPWPNLDLLTNTIIKVMVNAEGVPISTAVQAGSGLKAADDYAREQVRSARFESVVSGGPQRSTNAITGLTLGEILFEWQTLPLPSTNALPPSVRP